jgi:hypothetical protein
MIGYMLVCYSIIHSPTPFEEYFLYFYIIRMLQPKENPAKPGFLFA